MAQHVSTICDLHDGETEANETLTISLDGAGYEIDVCTVHAVEVRESISGYVEHGRRVGGRRRAAAAPSRGRPGARKSTGGRRKGRRGAVSTAEIRQWAIDAGYEVSARGRIPAEIVAAYQQA